ncbi:hypothetical protein GQ44DRAFT_50693 [Phaeosphaeriaceae sp. PMI808]|nr:hypothetical protein GQ44DRAFT_50693 [Phaeosphaeriaceae sp. PMI808]
MLCPLPCRSMWLFEIIITCACLSSHACHAHCTFTALCDNCLSCTRPNILGHPTTIMSMLHQHPAPDSCPLCCCCCAAAAPFRSILTACSQPLSRLVEYWSRHGITLARIALLGLQRAGFAREDSNINDLPVGLADVDKISPANVPTSSSSRRPVEPGQRKKKCTHAISFAALHLRFLTSL